MSTAHVSRCDECGEETGKCTCIVCAVCLSLVEPGKAVWRMNAPDDCLPMTPYCRRCWAKKEKRA